ncbi:tetratricopeptide repeat protein [Marinoscillum sp. MHG1-6]|uniref:tetratricopeptide repeat protein n=1 Tax=Marinoscillum sp. MHG1-6 TaxID=2959627 RepID=UPI0021579597|nr:tetratricopeptide repeat protein [Marinoscillum sp. MHG1-6]
MSLKRLSLVLPLVLSMFTALAQSGSVARFDRLLNNASYQEAAELGEAILADSKEREHWYYVSSKIGDAQYYLGNIPQSLKYYLRALDYDEIYLSENLSLLEETHSYIGFCYRELGLDKRAENWFRKALQYAIQLNDSTEIAICYYNIGTVILSQGKLDASMEMLQKAYEIDLIRNDTSAIGFDLKMMGNAHMKLGQPAKAIDYFQQSIHFLEQSSGNMNSLGVRYSLVSKAFAELGQLDSATKYSVLAMDEYTRANDSLNLAGQWIDLAGIFQNKGDYAKALEWSQKAKEYFAAMDAGNQLIAVNQVLVQSYLSTGQFDKALILIQSNKELAVNLGLLPELKRTYELQAQVFEMTGKYEQAITAFKKSMALEDSIDQQRTKLMVEEMSVRYQVDKAENENELLRLENEIAQAEVDKKDTFIQTLFIVGLLVLLGTGTVAYLLVLRNRLKADKLQAEINELRVRIKGVLEFQPEQVGIAKEQINGFLNESLSDREFEVLNLALSNKTNTEIADTVCLSVNTVKYHLKNIYAKLGVSDRKEALKYVFQISSN